MPGVIMDHGSRNGPHTNHDRDQRHNGVNGVILTSEKTQEKGKGRSEPQQNMTPISPTMPNGLNGNLAQDSQLANGVGNGSLQNRVGELPPEILHITEGYMPLVGLLKRLAQHTHSELKDVLQELAQMPLPVPNGNSSHVSSSDDNSPENMVKKKKILDFAMNTHESWTKALVITGWSRKADEVSRAVDIRMHEKQASDLYKYAIDDMAMKKREFSAHKREANPDLRTAVPVLTTGKAHWMPDLGYIPPLPLTSKEVLQSLEKLNTLLSIRLNIDDYDTIPLQFKKFAISSGRVTFRVEGEFELDVTIADEDPHSQFWFIDFRFMFWPSATTLSPRIRVFIENKVNEILLRDGLSGSYKYLHEMILTYKISEFRRQAIDLGRAKWVETLKVEALNRALSVQYWMDRLNGLAAKSWIILGVHSGKREDGRPDMKSTSRLFLRWFRDHKEVKDVKISFDSVHISMEALLKVVIARHISHMLTDIFESFSALPLYASRELSLSLVTSTDDPSKPELKIQLTNDRHIRLKVDPISGRFVFSPTMLVLHKWEAAMNTPSRDPRDSTGKKIEGAVDKAIRTLESLRYSFISDDITTRGVTLGWQRLPDPGIKRSVLFEAIPKNTPMYLWFRKSAWAGNWYLLLCASMSGVTWFLIKLKKQATPLDPNPEALGIGACLKIPINTLSPTIDYAFLATLTTFTSGLLSQYSNLKALHTMRVRQIPHHGKPSKSLSIPSIFIKISELLTSSTSTGPRSLWAKDIIKLTFQGIELRAPYSALVAPSDASSASQSTSMVRQSSRNENAVLVTQARMIVPLPRDFTNLNQKVDPDIAFNSGTGSFAFRLRSEVGHSVIPSLIERIFSIERLVDCVQVLQRHETTLKCESVSLGKLIFTYSQLPSNVPDADSLARQVPQYRAAVDFRTRDNKMAFKLEQGNPHLRILNFLISVLNAGEGLDGVAKLLALTLPVLRGLDAIEEAWNDVLLSERGEVIINARAADWFIIRYGLRQGLAQDPMRKIQFEVRLRQRRGVPWWYVHRTDNKRARDADNLDNALKPLWASDGLDWRGMRTTGVAQNNGAEELLVKFDDLVRSFTLSGVNIQPQQEAEASAQVPKQAPSRQQQYQPQPRQQPTPNQSQSQSQNQSQSQGRGPLKREYVEID